MKWFYNEDNIIHIILYSIFFLYNLPLICFLSFLPSLGFEVEGNKSIKEKYAFLISCTIFSTFMYIFPFLLLANFAQH